MKQTDIYSFEHHLKTCWKIFTKRERGWTKQRKGNLNTTWAKFELWFEVHWFQTSRLKFRESFDIEWVALNLPFSKNNWRIKINSIPNFPLNNPTMQLSIGIAPFHKRSHKWPFQKTLTYLTYSSLEHTLCIEIYKRFHIPWNISITWSLL